jgi:hypothetical protein
VRPAPLPLRLVPSRGVERFGLQFVKISAIRSAARPSHNGGIPIPAWPISSCSRPMSRWAKHSTTSSDARMVGFYMV